MHIVIIFRCFINNNKTTQKYYCLFSKQPNAVNEYQLTAGFIGHFYKYY